MPDKRKRLTGRETYNVVTDTVTGVNVRGKDNKLQAKVIALFTVLGAAGGELWFMLDTGHFWGVNAPVVVGLSAVGGALAGLVVSGIYLAIYRGVRHAQGKHD